MPFTGQLGDTGTDSIKAMLLLKCEPTFLHLKESVQKLNNNNNNNNNNKLKTYIALASSRNDRMHFAQI